MSTIDELFPEITRYAPNNSQLEILPVAKRKFVRNSLQFILKSSLLTPFLKLRIARFIAFENQWFEKTDIHFISFEFRRAIWEVYNKITDNKNCTFKSFLKHNNSKLRGTEHEYALLISRITKKLFTNCKHPNNTRNIEIANFIRRDHFRYTNCINATLDRINFNLCFQKSSLRGFAQPIVLSSSRYLQPLNRINTDEFKTARIYYKDLLKKYFSEFYARIEIGVKAEYDYSSGENYNGIIHCHAFVKPDEYEAFLNQAKAIRAQCRKDGVKTHLFDLKVKKLVKKQECQSAYEFVQREFDYACKFSVLEGCVNGDFYKAKTTRMEFAQYFKQKHESFIENIVQRNYKSSLISRKRDSYSFKENKAFFNLNPELKTEYVKSLLKMHQKLLRLKQEIKTVKTPATVQHTDSEKQVKIEQTTWPRSSKFAKTLQYFKRIILPPLRFIKPKPPD